MIARESQLVQVPRIVLMTNCLAMSARKTHGPKAYVSASRPTMKKQIAAAAPRKALAEPVAHNCYPTVLIPAGQCHPAVVRVDADDDAVRFARDVAQAVFRVPREGVGAVVGLVAVGIVR